MKKQRSKCDFLLFKVQQAKKQTLKSHKLMMRATVIYILRNKNVSMLFLQDTYQYGCSNSHKVELLEILSYSKTSTTAAPCFSETKLSEKLMSYIIHNQPTKT